MTQPPRRKLIFSPLQRGWASMCSMQRSHRLYIHNELSHVSGLVPLLMKRRNGERWSREDREKLLHELRALSNLSPYLIPIIMPGGILMLPLLAWWMDRRRHQRVETGDR